MAALEEIAKLSAIITTRLKAAHKELIDELLARVPASVPPDLAADFVVTLLSEATFGLGVQMCIEDGLPDELIRSALESIIADAHHETEANRRQTN